MRFLGRFLLFIIALALIGWAVASVALNGKIKDRVEAELTRQLGQKVTIGHLQAGWDPLHPAVAAMNVSLGADPKAPVAAASKVEIGVFLKNLHTGMDIAHEPLYAAVSGIEVAGKPYGDYEADVAVPRDMHFDISDLKGEYKGAKIAGSGSEDTKYHWKADLTAENLDYSAIASGVKGGKAHVTLHLNGIDESQNDILAHLSGRATLVGGEGKLEGNAINMWAGSLLTAFLPGQDKDTHLNCAVADFEIINGIAHSKTVVIDTDKATVTGSGTVNLVKQRVDMRFTPRTKGIAVLSLATPVIVSGPFGDITTRPEATGMAEKMGGLLLTAVAPPMALLPFLHSGGDSNPCQKLLEQKSK